MTAFLASFWRFDGRLARLAYALRCVVAIAFFLVLLILGADAFGLTVAEESGAFFFVEPIPNTVLTVLFCWVMFALPAQRVRDMGLPVLPIIAALIALELRENFVLPGMTDARLPAPLEAMTPLGGILSIAALLWLFAWPSARDRAPNSARPDPSRRNGASPPPPA
ncbi:DUF805 domain-containing protein [Bosea sp. LjRoot90]|uniref:DUF805 domain-containing protein n=1 Tax=Bosea sp. LjRoot90 TaxID=3342342 RepID=UPI003F508742